MSEFGYYAKQFASDINMSTSKLRRLSIELENLGYMFERNDKEQRIYYEYHYELFEELQTLIEKGVHVADACKVVVSKHESEVNATQTLGVQDDKLRLNRHEIEEMMISIYAKARADSKRELEEMMNTFIETRDKKLVDSLRSSLEIKQLQTQLDEIKATLNQVATSQEQKKSFWQRLFSKHK